MNTISTHAERAPGAAFIAALAVLFSACGGDAGPDPGALQPGANAGQAAQASAGDSGQRPDINQLAQVVIEKINKMQEVEGTATLVEFKQVSAKTEVLGDMGVSTVLECAGVVTFSKEVHWNWQGGVVQAGEPAKFEVRAEYFNEGNKGWQLVPPLGIFPIQ